MVLNPISRLLTRETSIQGSDNHPWSDYRQAEGHKQRSGLRLSLKMVEAQHAAPQGHKARSGSDVQHAHMGQC